VIKGWDVVVGTMKLGESCRVTLRADYAYGEAGSPPKIPGGATLIFDIELLSWKSIKDVAGAPWGSAWAGRGGRLEESTSGTAGVGRPLSVGGGGAGRCFSHAALPCPALR
jgi:hypothetical protein